MSQPPRSSSALSRGVLCLAAVAGALDAQTWRQALPATSPAARTASAMATHAAMGSTVLFGGYADPTYLADTWLFDGAAWTAVAGTAPVRRARHAMAYDEARSQVVLFGGVNGNSVNSYLGDTWLFTNGAWQQRSSAAFPAVRFGHAMAYDRASSRVVMFGGRTRSGTIFLGDTWLWDGTSWTPNAPAASPSPRMGHAMALAPTSGHVVLFGGMPLGGGFSGDTWTWNGATWMPLAPAHAPTPRMNAVMAEDPVHARVVLYGGYDSTDLADTYEWDGTDWRLLAGALSPSITTLPALATGPAGRHVVLFGGARAGIPRADTWWNGYFAEVSAFGVGCGSPPLSLAPAAGAVPLLGQAFQSEIHAVPAGATAFQGLGFDDKSMQGRPLPLDLGVYQLPGCWLYHDAAAMFLPCTGAGSVATHSLAIPNDPTYAGWVVFLQGYVIGATANPPGVVTSNALALRIGF